MYCKNYFVVTCAKVEIINGNMYPNKNIIDNIKYPYGTTISFTCNSGYTLSENRAITCLSSGMWDGSTPVCNQSKELNATLFLRFNEFLLSKERKL